MSPRPVRLLIEDMLERIDRIERYVAGLEREAFLRDVKTADAVVRNLEVIGEAASRLPHLRAQARLETQAQRGPRGQREQRARGGGLSCCPPADRLQRARRGRHGLGRAKRVR